MLGGITVDVAHVFIAEVEPVGIGNVYGEVVYFVRQRIHQFSEGTCLSHYHNTLFPSEIRIGKSSVTATLIYIVPCRYEILTLTSYYMKVIHNRIEIMGGHVIIERDHPIIITKMKLLLNHFR